VIRKITQSGYRNLVLVAKEFSKEVVNMIEVNNRKNASNILLIEAEGFSNSRINILEDIAMVTNSTIVSIDNSTSISLQNMNIEHLGKCSGVIEYEDGIVLKYFDNAILESEEIKAHVHELHTQLKELDGNNSPIANSKRNILKTRLYKFINLATIYVGGITKAEAKEKKDRLDDAVHAISSSINNGVIYGGGVVLLHAIDFIKQLEIIDDVKELLTTLCLVPIRTLLKNGLVDDENAERIINKLRVEKNLLFNQRTLSYETLEETSIYDPANALIESLYNVLSILKVLGHSFGMLILENQDVL
jgi:chaperonin GroEL